MKCVEGCTCGRHSESARRRISEFNRGKTLTEEHKEKIGNGNRRPPGRHFDNNGYVYVTGVQHPLSTKGLLYEHRQVLYDQIGPGPHECHWGCGRVLEWGTMEGICVDHLDDDKSNNTPENLAPSCFPCNITRTKREARAIQTAPEGTTS